MPFAPNAVSNIFNAPSAQSGGMFGLRPINQKLLMAGLGMLSGGNPQEQYAGAARGLLLGTEADNSERTRLKAEAIEQARNAALQSVIQEEGNPLGEMTSQSPALGGLFAADPDLAVDVLTDRLKPSTSKYGLTPFFMKDKDGNLKAFQLDASGGMVEVEGPEGFTPAETLQIKDLGTTMQPVGTRSGLVTGAPIPIDTAGEAEQKEFGGAVGKFKAAYPSQVDNIHRIQENIDSALADPALGQVTGPWQSRLPTLRGDTARAESYVNVVLGGTFLQAYNDLRGAGAITEQEGAAAMNAYSRLKSLNMGDADYREALLSFKTELDNLLEVAARKYEGDFSAPPPRKNKDQLRNEYNLIPED